MNPQDSAPGTPEQQVIDRLKTAVNVLVTVSNNPSVDQLAAAIGFTLLLNKLGKHATAVFSGQVPSTIEFLKPDATIEKDTNSLRDFIVSLDKSKADKLRYKVEQNVVKIFITPYRTSLSENDLEFSQGDFNVDAVVALGITEREQLDQAIISHGRILHDATVITVSAGSDTSSLGVINWQDANASSLCEMLSEVGEALQPGLMDGQIATALLTGIVAQTERFRNDKTTPKIMSLSAKLMAAGANQQLIATQLENAEEVDLQAKPEENQPEQNQEKVDTSDGALTIEHQPQTKIAESEREEVEEPEPDAEEDKSAAEIAIDEHGNILAPKEPEKEETPPEDEKKPRHKVIEPLPEVNEEDAARPSGFIPPSYSQAAITEDGLNEPHTNPLVTPEPIMPPVSPVDVAAMPANESEKTDQPTEPAQTEATTPANAEPATESPEVFVDPVSDAIPTVLTSLPPEEPTVNMPAPGDTLSDIEQAVKSPHVAGLDNARDAVQSAVNSTPYDPNRPQPLQSLNANHVDLGMDGQPTSGRHILPPAPEQPEETEDPSGQSPPPVPPPMVPLG